jgi:hypothetical protein
MFDLPVFLASPRPGARRAAHGKRGDQNEGCDLNDTETLPTTQRCVHGSGMLDHRRSKQSDLTGDTDLTSE